MKRLIAGLLLFIMLLSALAPVLAANDYQTDAEVLKELGVLEGNENGDLMLNNNLRRQDMVVLISRLYPDGKEAGSYVGRNVFSDLNSGRSFYIPYINWARDKGLIQGQETNLFGFNANTTVQEFQTVLLRALGYGEEAQNWNQVPEIAKSLGIMNNLNLVPSSRLTRGQMASMVLNTLRETKKASLLTLAEIMGLNIPEVFKVNEKLTINRNIITLEGTATGTKTLKLHIRPRSSSITGGARILDVNLDINGNFKEEVRDLQAGEYEYRFEGSNRNTSFKAFTIEDVEFALIDVLANNLKEITLVFTQPVDTSFASFVSNYTTTAGTIKEVRFEDNNKKVMLVLNGTMSQQNTYKINASLKSVDGQEVKITQREFTALDTTPPTVLNVMQLGNKGLKVTFSEPIKGATASNFKINDRNFNGNVNVNNNEVVLNYPLQFNLSEGSHSITITGIVDFADYHAIIDNRAFTVINDTTAPKIVGASATLEEVIIEFDEDIYSATATVNRNNFYWRVGNSKRYPDSVTYKGNKAYLSFKNNRLSLAETNIYVENVTDYSGNKMKLTDISVTPVIDRTPPTVVSYNVAEDGRSIKVFYSKNVDGKNRANYTIKDQSDRTIFIRDIQGSDREFTIYLSQVLPVGLNTLTIQGVQDTTPLKNPLVPFADTIDMKDVEKPEIVTHSGFTNHIIVGFSKEMDYASVTNPDNYYITFNGSVRYLPYDSLITLSNDGKTVTILLPETIAGTKVVVGQNLTSMDISRVKDTAGNDLKNLIAKLTFDSSTSGKAKASDYYPNRIGRQGVLVDENTIKVRFNIPIMQASENDFELSIPGRNISYVEVDGTNEVTLYLNNGDSTSIPDGSLRIKTANNMVSYIQTGVEGGVINLVDEVAPRVKYDTSTLRTSGYTIELPFTEVLEEEAASLYRRDLEVYREEDGQLLTANDYTTSLHSSDKSILRITITNRSVSSHYSVRVAGENGSEPTYIRDTQGNLAIGSGLSYRTDSRINR